MIVKLKKSAAPAAALALVAMAPAAGAQEVPPPAASTDTGEPAGDIIVTGSKRDTSLFDSDTSVTVLDRETLEQARIRDLRQLDKLVPNVKFTAAGQLSDLYISVRGIESNPYLVNRTAVYVDGIPFRELSNVVLNQVSSVEVLRGPQGTLYGANSESGLILVTTRAPGDALAGELRLTGTDFSAGNGGSLDGFLGGPIINDKLAASVAFKLSREDSFLHNLAPFDGHQGRIDQAFLQGRLRWTPTDTLTVSAMAYALDTDAPGVFEYEYVPLDLARYDANYADAFNGGREVGRFSYANDAPKLTRKRERVAGASARWELGYGRIDAAGSYRRDDSNSRGYDLDLTAAPILAGQLIDNNDVWNGELRFTSPDHRPFEYIVGGAIYDQRKQSILATLIGPGGLDSYSAAPAQYAKGRDYSGFVSASYTPTWLPRVTASAGLRYDSAHRAANQTAGALDLGPSGVFQYRAADLENTFKQWLPRAALRYRTSDRLTLHASISKGYIPGGFNLTAVQAGIDDDAVLRYESETLWSKEIGFKLRLPDNRGFVAGAIFHIVSNNWQEIQVATDSNGRPVTSDYIGSGASIRSQGFELEGSYRPMPRVSLIANGGYVDARYRDLAVGDGVNLRGNRVKLTPEFNAYGAVQYDHPSGVFVRGEVSGTGSIALDERNRAFQPAVTVFGLQLGYERDGYSARLFGENLTNRRRFNGLALDNLAFGRDGTLYGPVDRPRVIGIELSKRL